MSFYSTASRSPPGQDPKLLSFLEFGITFTALGSLLFGDTFANQESLWEDFGCILVSKNTVWGTRGATRGTHVKVPANDSPIWTLSGSHFLKISFVCAGDYYVYSVYFQGLVFVPFLLVFEQTETIESMKHNAPAIKKKEGVGNQQRRGQGSGLI